MRESAGKINSSTKLQLFKTFDASKDEENTKLELIRNTETVFIYKQNFGKNKLNFFHHLLLIGGYLYNPLKHFGAIQGIDEEVASVVTPDMSQLLEISAVATLVPSIEDYLKVETIEDTRKLKASRSTHYTA